MGEVLYEVQYQFEIALLIPLIMLIVIPIGFRNESKDAKVFGWLFWAIVLGITIFVGKHQFDLYQSVVGAYKAGDYEIVEGYVENFVPQPSDPLDHGQESFDIKDVHFSYSIATVMTGYHTPKFQGGVITGNGQYLKIGYIPTESYLDNIIVYIESLTPPEPH